MNIFAKLAYNDGLAVSRFITMRFLVLTIGSYVFGRFFRKTDFSLGKIKSKKLIVARALITILAKALQYTSILYIPLSLSSCISFAAGPIIAYIIAFMLIREKLSASEFIPIVCGILGTAMITMPQWFLWLGIDEASIQSRLNSEVKTNAHYYKGILFGFLASVLDIIGNFMIRKVGHSVSKGVIPFVSGLVSFPLIFVVVCFYEPFDFGYFFGSADQSIENSGLKTTDKYPNALLMGFLGSIFGWLGLELVVIGVNISKSAVASYGEMVGIVLPFIFDMAVLDRTLVMTDLIGLVLIILLQLIRGFNSFKEQKQWQLKQNIKLMEADSKDADAERLYKT